MTPAYEPVSAHLRDAVARLYRAFREPRRADMEGCPCCVTGRHRADLYAADREKLPASIVEVFAFKAMTTWGQPEDYRHFLPRILELAAMPEEFRADGLDFDVIMQKLELGGFRHWPEGERDGVGGYFRALWTTLLENEGSYPTASILAAAACVLGDSDELVNELLDSESRHASVRMAELVLGVAAPLHGNYGTLQAWHTHRRAARVAEQLVTARVQTVLERGFFAHPDGQHARLLSDALDVVTALAKR